MKAEILTPDELTREDIDSLWAQDVCMDDWDYIILAPVDSLKEYERMVEDWGNIDEFHNIPMKKVKEFEQMDYTLDRCLVGCCTNTWYKAKFRGKEYGIGVAYHS